MLKNKLLTLSLLFSISLLGQQAPNYKFPWVLGSDPCDQSNTQGTHAIDQNWINHYRKTNQWELVFVDQFDGTELNEDHWQTHFNWGPYVTENNYFYYTQDNVEVDNGILKLSINRDPDYYDLWNFENGQIVTQPKWYDYTAGMIFSKATYQSGKFEIRCKLPSNLEDLNPAFWLYGDCNQEIDVFEFLREDKQTVNLSIHGSNVAPRDCSEEHRCINTYDVELPEDFHEDKWHTYSVEWTIHSIIWRIDGVIKRQIGRVISGQSEVYEVSTPGNYTRIPSFPYLDTPMHIIVNLGEVDTENLQNGTLWWQRHMEIDYVKIYKEKRCHLNIYVCDNTDLPVFVNYDDYFLMDTVNISFNENCHYNLKENDKDYFYYTSVGYLNNNTTIEKGSIFELNPMSCSTNNFKKQKVVGLNDPLSSLNDVQVYPNPSENVVYVKALQGSIKRVSLYSSTALLSSKECSSKSVAIEDLKELSKGVYYIKIELNDGQKVFRKIIHN